MLRLSNVLLVGYVCMFGSLSHNLYLEERGGRRAQDQASRRTKILNVGFVYTSLAVSLEPLKKASMLC